ncbi:IclR family transcriptional regulator [Rhodococcus sp. I2R]|uniref:IclR family transcriptional regulator n=1 Tax=Rhodococcus sp. I2R TaxID=2855445 RepID=UPI00096866E9|nr:IclR family transcriptional regulator [Rhodococcus sp. I2R]MCC8929766.1 IclR family transcriptional regulator [Rhodococcus sp. I2R]OLT36482.1 IclR family transcriptional regulator [Rhodococcus sp. CUA-806]
MATDSSGYRERNSTADRALVILGLFTEDRLQISANDVAEALGSARSTAYRYLQTLVAASFLEEAPGGGFRLGIGVLELARLARRGYGLTAIAQPVMRALADEVGETVLLTRLVDDTVVCIERCEGAKQLVRLSYERGSRLPINAGASALTLLAWLPEKEIRELLGRHGLQRFTERTLTDVDVLVQRLAEIRSAGYGMTVAEVDPDATGIAAPIFDDSGAVAAALSIVAIRRRVPEDRSELLVTAVRTAAETLSRKLAVVRS